MSHHPDDHRTSLVHGRLVAVDQCACGVVHCTIGAITLHLQRDAFCEVADALSSAAVALVARSLGPVDDRLLT